jgi:Amt family ammonium transporter
MLALGLFANGEYGEGWNGVKGPVKGLLYGDAGQLVAQLVGMVVNVVAVGGLAFLFFKLVDRLIGLRVSPETETNGLDGFEMGSDAYPNA